MIPSDSLRLWSIEIPPFQALIDSGIDAVMIAHVHAPDYQPDSDTPASMSPFWVNNILKKQTWVQRGNCYRRNGNGWNNKKLFRCVCANRGGKRQDVT